KKLPNLAINPEVETTTKDDRGVFELPAQEDLVSAWINSLPKTQISEELSLNGPLTEEHEMVLGD
ncbi:hypothetical protein QP445_14120, partial [Micrococcus luteus]|nr:hypothetical protein [Micrococcus luteus]